MGAVSVSVGAVCWAGWLWLFSGWFASANSGVVATGYAGSDACVLPTLDWVSVTWQATD